MDNYLDWNNNNLNYHQDEKNNGNSNPNVPTSTINDQDLLDFSGLDQFIPTGLENGSTGFYQSQQAQAANSQQEQQSTQQLAPQIKEEYTEDDDNEQLHYQPQSYHATSSSFNNNNNSLKTMSSSLSGVRRSLSKAMSNSRKNSIIKDELSSSFAKSPRSRKSSIVGTPGSIAGSLGNSGQTTSVERKRRDNINDKIQELLTIIPETFFYENGKSTGTKDGKPNKGQILSKSVEYIQFLQNEIDFKNRKEVEYIYKLKKMNFDTSIFTNTSAEIGLGKIGVGPLSHLQHEEAKRKWQLQYSKQSQQPQQQAQQQQQQDNGNNNNNYDADEEDRKIDYDDKDIQSSGNNDNDNNGTNNYNSNDNDNQDFLNF